MHDAPLRPAAARTRPFTAPGAIARILPLLAACAAIAFAPAAARAQWTDITTPALAETTWIHDKKGVAMVDFDGDGDLDICSVGEGVHAGALFRNDGGTFVDVTPGPLVVNGSGSGQTWGDIDNDGDPDLFVSTEEEPMRLIRNDGAGVFTNVTSGLLLDPAHGHSTAWVDYDRDGLLDLYVAYFKQASRLLRNTGAGLVDATTDSLGIWIGDGVVWGDYDNDLDPDVYLIRFSQWPSVYMRNDGALGFTNATTPVMAIAGNGHSGACADYDNDGDLDIYYVNANLPNHLLRNNGHGEFVDATPANLILGAHSVGACWSDFDNDGWLDLYVTETDNGVSHMFHNDGDGTFTEVTSGPLSGSGTAAGIASGDIDGDGDLDLYVSSYGRRANHLLRNDLANGNHWIELDLEGVYSNRSAIGARIWLTAGGMTQMREISSCTGFRSQNALTVHFGLGAATQVDSIRIRWPSGIVLDTTLAAVDQRVKVVERMTFISAPTSRAGAAGLALAAPSPNPASGPAAIGFTLPATAPARLAVLDAQGRMIRVLADGARAAGSHRVTWDGRDAAGARVPGGVYWCVLESAGERVSRRIAVVP